MCGIAGFWGWSPEHPELHLRAMTDAIRHRGPDGEGVWVDVNQGIALGHRRLSIIDLSNQGNQPMSSASGRFVITFNGEIYNYRELRSELERSNEAPLWRGHSDTEVLLAAIDAWGLHESLLRINGMFAIALWDRERNELSLARDRFGEKPLYFFSARGGVAFASELKALQHSPGWIGRVDRDALASLLTFDYVPAPKSIFADVSKLAHATLAVFAQPQNPPTMRRYWDAVELAIAATTEPFETENEDQVLSDLESALARAVKLRMHADVPLGALLSGGVDSSLVVAMMQLQSKHPVQTFTIGFDDAAYDESYHAMQVAKHLKTEHTQLIVKPEDALAVVPTLPRLYDEPFADASQIPTFLVSKLARKQVSVALSGDGGDELFGGYNRHQWIPRLWGAIGWLPMSLRRSVSRALFGLGPTACERLFRILSPLAGQEGSGLQATSFKSWPMSWTVLPLAKCISGSPPSGETLHQWSSGLPKHQTPARRRGTRVLGLAARR